MKKLFVSYFAWATAVIATSGSLFASEIAHLPPCVLCWYQRIMMYPLVIVLTVGILKKDKILPFYVLPMSLIGAGIAFYQYLLQRGIFPNTVPCALGISCTTKYVEWFGFVTIPFLSLMGFVVITGCMFYLLYKKE